METHDCNDEVVDENCGEIGDHGASIQRFTWRSALDRAPIEAMANGMPVLASDRGALPQTLGDAGFGFMIPD